MKDIAQITSYRDAIGAPCIRAQSCVFCIDLSHGQTTTLNSAPTYSSSSMATISLSYSPPE